MTTGVTNLDRLLKEMNPVLRDGTYSFCSIKEDQLSILSTKPLMVFREKEGVTVIVESDIQTESMRECDRNWKVITLTIHSSLNAVGLLAKISSELANHGISVNVVSAYFHDHLFVKASNATRTLEILNQLSES